MKRLWTFFSRMDLGFWLLIFTSLNLFVGVLVTTCHEALFKKLNFMNLPAWIQSEAARPGLYLWMITLFGLLLLLAINTTICTTVYTRTAMRQNRLMEKLGIILFHIAFVIALGGHCTSEFIGLSEQITIDTGTTTQVPGTGLAIETIDVRKITSTINGAEARLGIEATLKAAAPGGQAAPLEIKTMEPQFSLGYTFHLSFMDKGLAEDQAQLIVRRDYGLVLIILAGITALLAIVLYMRFTLRERRPF